MPRTTASTSQASSSRAQSSQPTMEQWEMIFETTFDITRDFKNFEATQWAIQEFTRRGLKKIVQARHHHGIHKAGDPILHQPEH